MQFGMYLDDNYKLHIFILLTPCLEMFQQHKNILKGYLCCKKHNLKDDIH